MISRVLSGYGSTVNPLRVPWAQCPYVQRVRWTIPGPLANSVLPAHSPMDFLESCCTFCSQPFKDASPANWCSFSTTLHKE